MITVKKNYSSREEKQWIEYSFKDFYRCIEHNRESKWERHRSKFDLVSYWMRWTIFHRRRWEWILKYSVSTRIHPWIVAKLILIPINLYVTEIKYKGSLMDADSRWYRFNSENWIEKNKKMRSWSNFSQ